MDDIKNDIFVTTYFIGVLSWCIIFIISCLPSANVAKSFHLKSVSRVGQQPFYHWFSAQREASLGRSVYSCRWATEYPLVPHERLLQ